jgi:tRNA(Ile2)-agmatinylcytidine synthase
MTMKTIHIGLDDTDSTRRGCTTYVAALLVEKLQKLGVNFIDYPNLIRLNPNVPWKTRGNGALCLRIVCDEDLAIQVKEAVVRTVEENADLECEGTEPGVVFLEKARIPKELKDFAEDAITGIVTLRRAFGILKKLGGEAIGFKNGRGMIGGLAAIGETLQGDFTYEILAYRTPENRGSKRKVDEASIFEMERATKPYTFNNIDPEKRRVIITPRGPDPILLGIRGESPEIVKRAFETVKLLEPVERWLIFRTNQGTDAHLRRISNLNQTEPYSPIVARGTVATQPRMISGRHVIFSIEDATARVDCAAYEPTGTLRKAAYNLVPGDCVEVSGGVRAPSKNRPSTVNLEKLRVLRLVPKMIYCNPFCLECGDRLKSMGRSKGFRCEKCGARYNDLTKVEVKLKRAIRKGLFMTSARSQRHLTKPVRRYGMEKRRGAVKNMIDNWHFP